MGQRDRERDVKSEGGRRERGRERARERGKEGQT